MSSKIFLPGLINGLMVQESPGCVVCLILRCRVATSVVGSWEKCLASLRSLAPCCLWNCESRALAVRLFKKVVRFAPIDLTFEGCNRTEPIWERSERSSRTCFLQPCIHGCRHKHSFQLDALSVAHDHVLQPAACHCLHLLMFVSRTITRFEACTEGCAF